MSARVLVSPRSASPCARRASGCVRSRSSRGPSRRERRCCTTSGLESSPPRAEAASLGLDPPRIAKLVGDEADRRRADSGHRAFDVPPRELDRCLLEDVVPHALLLASHCGASQRQHPARLVFSGERSSAELRRRAAALDHTQVHPRGARRCGQREEVADHAGVAAERAPERVGRGGEPRAKRDRRVAAGTGERAGGQQLRPENATLFVHAREPAERAGSDRLGTIDAAVE